MADLRSLADEDLMHQVARANADAFEVLYERHSSAAYSLAYRILGAKSAAEDAVQEAFISIWRSGARYERHRGSVRTWVLGIVHNRSIDVVRRSSVHDRRRSDDETAAELLASPDRTDVEASRREEARTVRGALEVLPPDQLKVIELAYYGGFSQSEIADMLGAPLGTIKGRMRLGLEKMRMALEHA